VTDRPVYSTGELVDITNTVKNIAARACVWGYCASDVGVKDQAGQAVWTSDSGEMCAPGGLVLRPGESRTFAIAWDQTSPGYNYLPSGGRPRVPKGTYTVFTRGSRVTTIIQIS
jgi:hypothetical protein